MVVRSISITLHVFSVVLRASWFWTPPKTRHSSEYEVRFFFFLELLHSKAPTRSQGVFVLSSVHLISVLTKHAGTHNARGNILFDF